MVVRTTSLIKRIFQRKNLRWIILTGLLLLAGGLAGWYFLSPKTASPTSSVIPDYYTARVKRGNLRISITGGGKLASAQSVDLNFSTTGTVATLNTSLGARVSAGDVLAKLSKPEELEANLATCELNQLQAKKTLSDLYKNKEVSLAKAYQAWISAEQAYNDALQSKQREAYPRCSKETNKNNVSRLEKALENFKKWDDCCRSSDEWVDAKNNYETAYANYQYCIAYTADEKTNASASLDIAQSEARQAEATYNAMKANSGIDPDELAIAEASLKEAQAKLDLARQDLEGIELVAPIDGTVISIAAGEGEMADTEPYMTIANLEKLKIEFSANESNISKLTPGSKVEVTFDAIPDHTFTGKVTVVNPALVDQGPFQIVKGTIELDPDKALTPQLLLVGLNATVEIISQESLNTLLIPIEALHDLGGQEYAVFIQDSSRKIRLKTVKVGLMDKTYAEITDGVKEGDLVTTGKTKTN